MTFIALVLAVLIGYFVLEEELGVVHFADMVAIFLGLLLIDGRLFRRLPALPVSTD
ncbi:MAG: drug/metabolite transporter (DMT)-like permease [Yoonia sp.]